MSRLNQLAINNEGFIFDPMTGESYTVNNTAQRIIDNLKADKPITDILLDLKEHFQITTEEVERDLNDFINRLRFFKLY